MTIVNKKGALLSASVILSVLILDQALKIWVKTSFSYGEQLYIFDWFRLMFVENDGIAFGITLGRKIFLTLFRIVASCAVLWYTIHIIRQKKDAIAISSLSLIFAGATGNIIDCVFYGKLFGYETWFNGRVVDMLYFPLIDGHFWSWIPVVGGEHFIFFSPIFNIADSAICIGVAMLLLFEKELFKN